MDNLLILVNDGEVWKLVSRHKTNHAAQNAIRAARDTDGREHKVVSSRDYVIHEDGRAIQVGKVFTITWGELFD